MQRHYTEICKGRLNRTDLFLSQRRRHIWHLSLLSALFLFSCIALALAEEPAGKDLRLFYQQKCVHCHGVDGSAVGPDGKKLKGHDLTDAQWQKETDDDEMVHTILNGKFFGLAMPKFKNDLSKEEAQQMVTDIIRKAKKGVAIEPGTMGADEE